MLVDRMDKDMVLALFETIPVEITVIDANDEVVGWNKHENRLFKRPLTSVGMNFRDCHPQESLDKVIRIVEEMRTNKRDMARFWIDMGVGGEKHKILIEFYALRDYSGKYLGCVECTQDVEHIRKLEGSKRLLD